MLGTMPVSFGTIDDLDVYMKDSSGYNPEWANKGSAEETFNFCGNVIGIDGYADEADVKWCSEYVALMKSKGMSMTKIEIPEITYKKYIDEKYGFSFEYPSNWKIFVNDDDGTNEHYVIINTDVKSFSAIQIYPQILSDINFKMLSGDNYDDQRGLEKHLRMNCYDDLSMYEDGMDCGDFEIKYGGGWITVDEVRTLMIPYKYTIDYESGNSDKFDYQFILFDTGNDGLELSVSMDGVKSSSYEEEAIDEIILDKFIRSFTFDKSAIGGGCLIATATYGTELAPQVQLLREIRDNSLLQTESGTVFMKTFNEFYYSFSPTIADYERESPIFKEAVKIAITPMISTLSQMENANSESEVLGIGISLIILNLGMYIGIPAVVIIRIRKRF